MAALTPRAAPRPAEGAGSDERSYRQRMHDALGELAGITVRRGELAASGAPATVLITMTEDQYRSGQGLVQTSFGQPLTVAAALRLADEAVLVGLVKNATGAVLKLGRSVRIASRAQSLALIARDRGCSFPGCQDPPEWCQRHHVVPWSRGGLTDVANMTLLCGHHHREFDQHGWRCEMRDGLPWWIPPKWIDPLQKPQQNLRITDGA